MMALRGGIEINTDESRMKTVQCFDAAKLPRAAQNSLSSVFRTSCHKSYVARHRMVISIMLTTNEIHLIKWP